MSKNEEFEKAKTYWAQDYNRANRTPLRMFIDLFIGLLQALGWIFLKVHAALTKPKQIKKG